MKRKPAKPTAARAASVASKKSLAEILENWVEKNKSILLVTILLLAVALGTLQFNFRISEANDDSMYLEDAFKFSKTFFGHYTANAPFYPMFLSLVILIFGFELFLLKLTGFLFMIVHLFFLYKAFEKRIPYMVLFFVLLFTAVNPYMLYYASMTFTEQFFMMQQAIFMFLFFKAYDKLNEAHSIVQRLLVWLPVGLILFILTLSRNVAVGIIIPVVVFLIYQRKIKDVIYFLSALAVFRVPYEIMLKFLWKNVNQFSNQMNSLIRWKDPYDPSKGTEDLAGYIDRLVGNFNLYINKRLLQIFGFMSETDYSIKPAFGIIFIVLLLISAYLLIRKGNAYLIFTFLYTGALIMITFIAVQTRWDQLRLILVFVPLLLITFSVPFYTKINGKQSAPLPVIIILLILFTSTFISSIKKTVGNFHVLKQNISGDMYYGYTPDWVNYLKLSAWCADSLPKESLVACRKAPMSFIYGKGKAFYPIYQVFSSDADTIINKLKNDGVTHILLASLRRNPNKQDGYIINTLHRLVQPVIQKYPHALELIKTEGISEQAYLYRINYDYINSGK